MPLKPKHKNILREKSIRLIGWVSLILGFADAFWLYLGSSYLSQASGTENVALFYGVVFACVLGILLTLHLWVRWLGKTTLFSILLFFLSIFALALAGLPVAFPGMVLLGGMLLIMSITWVVMDIILEDCSTDNLSGRIRGRHLTLMNIGILSGPLAASQMVSRAGFEGVFMTSALLYIIVFLWATLGLRSMNLRFRKEIVLAAVWRKACRMPNVLCIYGVSFALELFYVVMIVYMPLRLLNLGFDWAHIGAMFTIALLPFVVLQYPLGVIADTKWGEKELLILSLLIMSVSVGVIALSESHSFWWWAGMLFVTRIGAAAVEVLRDAYFYKQIDGDDGDLIAFFRTTRPVANIVTALLVAGLLLWFPITSVFILSAVVSLGMIWVAASLEDTAVAQ